MKSNDFSTKKKSSHSTPENLNTVFNSSIKSRKLISEFFVLLECKYYFNHCVFGTTLNFKVNAYVALLYTA